MLRAVLWEIHHALLLQYKETQGYLIMLSLIAGCVTLMPDEIPKKPDQGIRGGGVRETRIVIIILLLFSYASCPCAFICSMYQVSMNGFV